MAGGRRRRELLRPIARRGLLLVATWWALTGGDPSSVGVGIAAVAVATFLGSRDADLSDVRVSPSGLVALAWTFVTGSLRGGWDVAWRALSPRMPVDPRLLEHQSALAPGAQRRIFATILTIMPGSLVVDGPGPELCIHVLVDRGEAFRREVARLESGVARAFRVVSKPTGAGSSSAT